MPLRFSSASTRRAARSGMPARRRCSRKSRRTNARCKLISMSWWARMREAAEFLGAPLTGAKIEPVAQPRRGEQASQPEPAREPPIEQETRRRAEAEAIAGAGGD